MMIRFRQDYLDLLDGRIATIQRLVARQEVEPARVALLSLETSSTMVGAVELAGSGRLLRAALGTADADDLGALSARLVADAGEVAERLVDRPV